MIQFHRGDCLDVLRTLADGSVDAVIADPPYGTTHLGFDQVIPFEPLWECLRRIIKPQGAIVLFGTQPFTSELIVSNREWFKYTWAWKKSMSGGVFNAKHRPLKNHEDIAVFSPGSAANRCHCPMKYRPQGLGPPGKLRTQRTERNSAFVSGRPSHPPFYASQATGYPKSVLEIGNQNGAFWGRTDEATTKHPMQKPIPLMSYLVRTYTDQGDTVLDFAMGSGTTGIACLQTGRSFIGVEINREHFATARRRIKAAQSATLAAV